MTAKDNLGKIQWLDMIIKNIKETAETAISESVRKSYLNDIENLEKEKKSIVDSLSKVTNIGYYDILFKYYVLNIPLKNIAIEKRQSYSNITTAHGRALEAYQKAMEET